MLEILHDVRNQDTESRSAVVAGVEGNFAWLMGGDPTPVSDTDNDEVAAFTAHLNGSLHGLAAIASDERVDLRQLLSEAVVQATSRSEPRDPFDVWSFPRTSMVLANVTPREVRLIQVGDVAWHISSNDGTVEESESEPAFAKLYQSTRGESRALRAKANERDGYPLVQAGKPGPLPVSVTLVRAFRPELVLIAGDWPWSREGVAPARLRVQSDD